jgi:predicted ArsR family transcriptional regulator
MKQTRRIQRLLERMAAIERMERGKVCPMVGRPHYNHQTWQDGRNVVRYVPAQEVASLQQAIDGYNLFRQLAEEYADEIIHRTREEPAKNKKPKRRGKLRQ